MTILKGYEFTFGAIIFAENEEDAKKRFDEMWAEGDFDNIADVNDWDMVDTGQTEEI